MRKPLGFVYDSGALIAAEKNVRSVIAKHKRTLKDGLEIVLPTTVLAQVWRGAHRSGGMAQLIAGCKFQDLGMGMAKAVGELCGEAGTKDLVDASVVMTAIGLSYTVVSDDTDDLAKLASAAGKKLDIVPV